MSKHHTNNKSLTEKVLNYEIHRLRNKYDRPSQMQQSQESPVDRYGEWRLPTVLGALGPIQAIESVKWLGYESDSHIYSLLYCLLRGCTASSRHAEKNGTGSQDYILLKYNMYKLASETLLPAEQKLIVELLSSAEYTNDISKFLCKYRTLERIFTSMFHGYIRRKKRMVSSERSLQAFMSKSKMEHLLYFVHQKFPFIGFKLFISRESFPEERIGIFVISDKKLYIIECNGCHFVAEAKDMEEQEAKIENAKRAQEGIIYSKIDEESEDNEQYEDIDVSETKTKENIDKRTSFGKSYRGDFSTPKFNPNPSMYQSKDQRQRFKDVRSFDSSDQSRTGKSFENIHNTSNKNIHSTLPSLSSIQSLINRMKDKRFYKRQEKGKSPVAKNGAIHNSLRYKSNTSIMGSSAKGRSYSLPKRRSLKTELKVKSIQKYRGSSPASPPSVQYPISPAHSPSHTTMCSPRRPSSQILQSQMASPVKGKKIVFTYAQK